MIANIKECEEKQQLIRSFDRKEIDEQIFKSRLLHLDSVIKDKLKDFLEDNIEEKFAEIKQEVEQPKIESISKYKLYKSIVELHRSAKELCEDIKIFKKEYANEDMKRC